MPKFSKSSFHHPIRISHQTRASVFSPTSHVRHISFSVFFTILIMFSRVKGMKILNMQFSEDRCYYTISVSNILLSNLFSNTLTVRCSLHVKNPVSQPCITAGKTAGLWTSGLTLNGRREDNCLRTKEQREFSDFCVALSGLLSCYTG
jgi:hypothetical protein